MKTNNTVINSIMNNEVNRTFMVKKSFLKYICAVLMIIGTSVHAWGTGIFLEYNSTKYYDGDMVTINLAQTTLPAHGSPSMAVKNDAGWTQDGAYRYGIITTTLSGTLVPSNVSFLMESYEASVGTPVGDDNETSYYTHNPSAQYWNASFQLGYYFAAAGTYDVTMTVTEKDQADGTTVLQSATITIRFVVTFSGYTITYNLTGLEHANPYNPTATSGEFHAEFELADNYSTPITGTYSDGFVTNAPITIGSSGDCYYNLGDLYYNATPTGNVTINLTATTTCTPLAAPTNLAVTENNDGVHGKTRFSWNAVSNASSYEVVVTRGGVSGSETTTNTYYEYTFGTGDYSWKVRANGDGSTYCEKNDYANGSDFCVGADLSAVTPSNLEASSITNTTATISWDEVANAVSYNVWVMNADEDAIIYDGSTTSTSFTATGLTAGTTYVVWWEATNSCAGDGYNSAVDNSLSFTTTNNHTVSFNANGGSGSIDDVIRAHGTTYDLPGCTFVAPSGKVFKCWAEGSTGGTERAVGYTHTVNADITFYAKWRDAVITDYVFSCSELTLTPHLVTDGTPIYITSTASKTVRSQDYIEITGNGLTPSTALTFPGLPSKFAIKNADGTAVTTDVNGEISANAYIFYTPDAGDTSDGLDKLTGITVSVGGAKPKTVVLTQDIIGRHLPADFVIAGKVGNKWYALPADFSEESTPDPVEIAVNDINNPSLAYTASTNIYNLYGQNSGASGFLYNDGDDDGNPDGEKIKLGMKNNSNKPLFAFASPKNSLKGDGTATVTNNINKQYWWTLKQTNTTSNITNAQDAKYILTSSNNSGTLSIKNSPFVWGTYASGVEELRLIPASNVVPTEAYFVEWAQHGGVIEVDAEGIDATSVVAHLGEATSAAITLVQTKASDAKNKSSKYNYTVNFGGSIDFAAAASNGAMLTLEWKKDATVKAMSNIIVPKIVAANATMSSIYSDDGPWSTADVHVLPGVTLTANAGDFSSKDVVVDRMEIYPGATVKVTKGAQDVGTLKVRTLVLRNGWTRVGSKNYDVARLYVSTDANLAKNAVDNVWYSDWYIDYDQYYPIAVPFWVATSSITYKNTNSAASAGVIIRYYDGERRAEHGQQDQEDNWVAYTWGGTMPGNLDPSKGYAMTAKRPKGKAFSIVRMPMTFTNPWTALGEHGYVDETHKDQVSVTGYGKGTASWYAMGWNFVGNPYMSIFNEYDGTGISGKITTQEGGSIKYATIPDLDFQNYYQVPIAEANLKPASGFFIQADNASPQTITFNADKIVPPSAPARYTTSDESVPEQEAYIRLSNGAEHDLMGLIIGEDYTEAYEPNADLAKLLGEANAVKTYMHYADMDMAYVAINATLAQEWIPVTVNIPAEGEYTFSITNSSTVDALEGVYLIDYANNNQVTNLIENDYVFTAAAGTISDRFAINAIVGQRETPTDIDIINAGGDIHSNEPIKFIWNDKVFILHRGVIYDSTGKRVREINR